MFEKIIDAQSSGQNKTSYILRFMAVTTLPSVAVSIAITAIVLRLTINTHYVLGISLATVTPLVVVSIVSFAYANMMVRLNLAMVKISELSNTDELTSLHNRRRFFELATDSLALGQRHGYPLSLLLIDLDRFKSVNDRFGHSAGDEVLRRCAAAFRRTARDTDILARFGGEEFVLLAYHTDHEEASTLCQRLQQELARYQAEQNGQLPKITASIGGAFSTQHGYDLKLLLNCADQALYQAKANGRNTFVLTGECRLDQELF